MNISHNTKLSLYQGMLKIRLIEERICALYSEQEIRCPVHLSIGQEATAVGMCEALTKEDLIFGNHRSHGHYLAKGGDLGKFFAELYGKSTGCCAGIGGSMHLIDKSVGVIATTPIVGSSIPVAMGASMANQMRGNDIVTVIFLGDGAIEEGVFHETLNFASVNSLPIVFFCENNLYSVYTHLDIRQPKRPLENLIQGYNVRNFTVDGNDILEIYSVAKLSCDLVRKNEGPVFIAANTYRWREHCGVNFDNTIGYRTEAEFEEWFNKCPIKRFETQLMNESILTSELNSKILEELNSEIELAVRFAKSSPFSTIEAIRKFLYVER